MRILIFSAYHQLQQSAAALATACHAARRGKRVLIASVGPGHLLADLIGQSLGSRPIELEHNLSAMEVSAVDEVSERWDKYRPSLRSGLASKAKDVGPDELPVYPGLDTIAAVLVADRAAQSGRFDLLVLDGPTPDMLTRSVALPDGLRWLLRLAFGLDRGVGRSRSSLEQAIVPAALIAPTAVAPLQDLRVWLEDLRTRFHVATGTRVRMVASPEELRLPPLRTTISTLGLYGIAVDEVIVPGDPATVDTPTRHEFSHEGGKFRPVLRIGALPWSPAERDTWALRGAALYRDGDIYDPHAPTYPPSADREVHMYVPFLDPKALDIAVATEEVIVRLGQLRRHLVLPGLIEGGRLRARVENESLRLWIE